MADANLTVQIDGRDNLSAELKKIESGVIRFVGAISSAFTALAAIGFPVAEAATFQKEILNAAKTTEYSTEAMLVLETGLRTLSNQINITAVDLAKIATMGGQMGIGANENAQALVDFTRVTATAVTSLGMSAEDVVNSFGKLINIFNIPQDQYRNAMSSILAVANASTAAADQLFDVVRRIGNLGGSVKLPEAAALSASMIDLGLTAETAGTTLTKIFADFKSNAKEFAAVVKSDSIKSMEDWIRLVQTDGMGALNAYADALNKMTISDASSLKGRLTGQGRLFEAISKIQASRQREVTMTKLAEEAEMKVKDAVEGRTKASESGLIALRAQAAALREAAVQSSVLSRMSKVAKDAYDTGDVAEKAQKLVLSGLISQWEVFYNNIKTLAAEAGRVFLPPLTEALKEASAALQNPVNAASLKQAAADILDGIKAIGNAILWLKSILGGLQGSGVDWGAVLRVGAILTGYAAFKGLLSLLGAFGSSIGNAIPGFNRLSAAIFGTVASSKGAKGALDSTAEAGVRTGGILNNVAGRIAASITATVAATQRLTAVKARLDAIVATTAAKQTVASDAAANVLLQNRLSKLQSVAAINQRINDQQVKYAALVAKGDPSSLKSASRVQGDITWLTRQRDALAANEAAVARYGSQITRLNTIIAGVGAQLAKVDLGQRFAGMVAPIAKAGQAAGTAFVTSFKAGAQAGVTGLGTSIVTALAPVGAMAAGVGTTVANAIRAGFVGAAAAATAGGARIVSGFQAIVTGAGSVRSAFASTVQSAQRLGASNIFAGMITGIAGVANAVGTTLAKGIGGALTGFGAMFANLGKSIGGAILNITGLGAAWDQANTRGGKALIGMAVGVTALGKVIGTVGKLVMSAFNFLFLGMMMIDVLKAIGLWDKLAEGIGKVIKFMGLPVPSFLQSDAEKRATAQALDDINTSFKGANSEAAKFTQELRAGVLMAQNMEQVVRDVKFNPDAPSKSNSNANQYIQSLIVGYSQVAAIQSRINANEVKITEEKKKQSQAQASLNNQTQMSQVPGGEFAAISALWTNYEQDVKDAAAAVKMLSDENEKLRGKQTAIGDLGKGVENVASAMFSAAEATAMLGRATATADTPLRRFADLTAGIAQQQKVLNQAEADRESALNKAGSSASAVMAANQAYANTTADATARVEQYTAEQKKLEQQMLRTSEGGTRIKAMLDAVKSSADPNSVRQFIAALEKIPLVQFKGFAVPKVEARNIVEAGVTYEVARRISSMYKTWADQAKEAATRAKNYATQALGEVEKLARNTEATILRLTQNAQQMQQKASNQIADRVDDAASRQRVRDMQTQYDVERALLEQQFAIQKRGLAEQEAGGVRVFAQKQQAYAYEQQALFELEEKYNKLKEIEADRLNLKKAQRAAKDEIAQYDTLIKRIEYLKKAAEEANRVISDPNAKDDAKIGAIAKRTDALDKMKAVYSQLETSAEKLSTIDPVGGNLVISPEELGRIRAGVEAASDTLGKSTLQGASKIEEAWNSIASSLTGKTNEYASVAEAALGKLQGFGVPIDQAAAAMGRLLGTSKEFATFVDQIQEKTKSGFVNPENIDFGRIQADAQKVADTLKNIKLDPAAAAVKLSIDQTALASEVRAAITKGAADASTGQTAQINAEISPSALGAMKSQIEGIKPRIEAEVVVDKITWSGGSRNIGPGGGMNARGGLIEYARGGAVERARGGVIGQAINFGEKVARFATGAYVSGPGGWTDDKIPAWLSNGEYVVDALTTSRFGPKFFATIQAAARGGMSVNFLKNIKLPTFAAGGPVSARPLAFAGIANDFKSGSTVAAAPRDVVNINLSSGNQRATIQAEREQAKTLVNILRNFEKGR